MYLLAVLKLILTPHWPFSLISSRLKKKPYWYVICVRHNHSLKCIFTDMCSHRHSGFQNRRNLIPSSQHVHTPTPFSISEALRNQHLDGNRHCSPRFCSRPCCALSPSAGPTALGNRTTCPWQPHGAKLSTGLSPVFSGELKTLPQHLKNLLSLKSFCGDQTTGLRPPSALLTFRLFHPQPPHSSGAHA